MIVRYCSCFFVPFYSSFSSIRHYLGRGSGGGNRSNDCCRLTDRCIQEVGVGRRTSRMRPMPTAVADVVDVAVAQEDAPAMDKSQW